MKAFHDCDGHLITDEFLADSERVFATGLDGLYIHPLTMPTPRVRRTARSVRLDDVLWERTTTYARAHGLTASDIVRDALVAYLNARTPA